MFLTFLDSFYVLALILHDRKFSGVKHDEGIFFDLIWKFWVALDTQKIRLKIKIQPGKLGLRSFKVDSSLMIDMHFNGVQFTVELVKINNNPEYVWG